MKKIFLNWLKRRKLKVFIQLTFLADNLAKKQKEREKDFVAPAEMTKPKEKVKEMTMEDLKEKFKNTAPKKKSKKSE